MLILKEHESGKSSSVIARECNISKNLYRWESKYSRTKVSDAKKLKQLEEESRRLEIIIADLTFDNKALKDIVKN